MITRLSLVLLVVVALSAEAQSEKAKGQGARVNSAARVTHARGSDAEIRIIREYYGEPSRKPKPLPPGMFKNLGRGKSVPKGIVRTRFPELLQARLPKREGTSWWVAGDQILLLDANDVVVDFFRVLK